MRLRRAPLATGGVLASNDYHPGVVAVYKRMHGRYLSQMRAWQLPGTAELTRLNLINELGLADDQFEILAPAGTAQPMDLYPRQHFRRHQHRRRLPGAWARTSGRRLQRHLPGQHRRH